MAHVITAIELHRYVLSSASCANETGRLGLSSRQPMPSCLAVNVQGYVSITMSYPDYVNLSRRYHGLLANCNEVLEGLA